MTFKHIWEELIAHRKDDAKEWKEMMCGRELGIGRFIRQFSICSTQCVFRMTKCNLLSLIDVHIHMSDNYVRTSHPCSPSFFRRNLIQHIESNINKHLFSLFPLTTYTIYRIFPFRLQFFSLWITHAACHAHSEMHSDLIRRFQRIFYPSNIELCSTIYSMCFFLHLVSFIHLVLK